MPCEGALGSIRAAKLPRTYEPPPLRFLEHKPRRVITYRNSPALKRFPVRLIDTVVTRGLDPRIHQKMDPRGKPAGDDARRAPTQIVPEPL